MTPRQLGNTQLDKALVKADRKNCLKFGPCGIGEKAIYLNSFYLDRIYYVAMNDVRRIFKRVAMTKGGFTGKGIFGSMPYLVVLLSDGSEKQCNFKYEHDVDNFISKFHERYPHIPIYSRASELKMAEERKKEEARYVKNLSDTAKESIAKLEDAKEYLDSNLSVSNELSRASKQKRIIDNIKPGYKFVAMAIVLLASAAMLYGVYSLLSNKGASSLYFVLFGGAFIFYAMSMQVLPTGKNNVRMAKRDFEAALAASKDYVSRYEGDFPVPSQYAHPDTIKRMMRVIREGKAETVKDAYEIMKAELKAINNTVTVSETEYNEITAIKPIFLECGYADNI